MDAKIDISQFWDESMFLGEKFITLRKIRFGELNDIRKETTNVKINGEFASATPDIGALRDKLVMVGIKMGPTLILEDGKHLPFKANDINYARNLPVDLGDYIHGAIEEYNSTSQKNAMSSKTV